MLTQIEKSFLELCDQSTCILVLPLDFEPKDTIITLAIDINLEKYENNYWGRPCHEGYCYQICRF